MAKPNETHTEEKQERIDAVSGSGPSMRGWGNAKIDTGNLQDECGASFMTAFISITSADLMLASFYNDKLIEKKKAIYYENIHQKF